MGRLQARLRFHASSPSHSRIRRVEHSVLLRYSTLRDLWPSALQPKLVLSGSGLPTSSWIIGWRRQWVDSSRSRQQWLRNVVERGRQIYRARMRGAVLHQSHVLVCYDMTSVRWRCVLLMLSNKISTTWASEMLLWSLLYSSSNTVDTSLSMYAIATSAFPVTAILLWCQCRLVTS